MPFCMIGLLLRHKLEMHLWWPHSTSSSTVWMKILTLINSF